LKAKIQSYIADAASMNEILKKHDKYIEKNNNQIEIDQKDFKANPDILSMTEPKPEHGWNDVQGLVQVKQALTVYILLPIKFPQLFAGARMPTRGILLYGVNFLID
jgi:SpoVK/Ycf46/Vps4 family AAA+-type ATPase